MNKIVKNVFIGIGSLFLYLILFATLTKFTCLITLIFCLLGTYYLYFKNEKFKRTNIFIKAVSGIFILFIILFMSVGLSVDTTNIPQSANNNYTSESNKESNDNEIINTESKEVIEETKVDEAKKELIEAKIHFINTGNSDAIVIQQGDKSVLIDAGDNDDETLIVNYLKKLNINKLDYVISTHPDADHCGSLYAVFNNFEVGTLFVGNGSIETKTYTDFINSIANKGISPSVPLEGSEYKLTDNSYLKIYTSKGVQGDDNESSLVALFVNGNDKMLFVGDAGEKTENKLLTNLESIDLLKVGHHGSNTSTSQAFLDKVNPKSVVILVGKDNKYRHPSTEVMARLESKGIEVHRTDECGDIVYTSTGEGVTTDCSIKGTYKAGVKEETSSDSTIKEDTNSNSNVENTTVTPAVITPVQDTSNEVVNNTQTIEEVQTTTESTESLVQEQPNISPDNSSSSTSNSSTTTNEPAPDGRIVYWTPNGKSYHFSKSCRTLSRSKTILEGYSSECPKTDPCDVCVH